MCGLVLAVGVDVKAPACSSKVQEAIEQIDFDLGMLDESIERYGHDDVLVHDVCSRMEPEWFAFE